MTTIDLSTFGPWKERVCRECETLQLCVGPPEGPLKCKACWLGPTEPGAGPRRRQSESLFDRDAYKRGNYKRDHA